MHCHNQPCTYFQLHASPPGILKLEFNVPNVRGHSYHYRFFK